MAKTKDYMRAYRAKKSAAASLRRLLDENGHVSLNKYDYRNYSQDDIERFLSTLPYETHMVFASDGTLIEVSSQFNQETVTYDLGNISRAIFYDSYSKPKETYTDVHIHPDLGDNWTIFSHQDIGAYVTTIKNMKTFNGRVPMKFSVVSYDGNRYTLEYVGGGSRAISSFQRDYAKAAQNSYNAFSRYSNWVDARHFVDDDLGKWLTYYGPEYGFKFTVDTI